MTFLGIQWSLFVDSCRLASLLALLLCCIFSNWYIFSALICTLASLYLLDRNKYAKKPKVDNSFPDPKSYRPPKRIRDDDEVPTAIRESFVKNIVDFVLYDAENSQALRNFEPVKMNTHCTFAKRAVLWGARDYDMSLSVEQNVERSIPALIKFLAIGEHQHLDGFVFELPGEEFGNDVHKFGQGVRRILKCLSDHDPSRYHCMNKSFLDKIGWSFEFNEVPIFVTTFAPCYPDNHSRFAFGAQNAFVLLQPMYSFVIHDIGNDTPHTNWSNPTTVRDKIRVAYKENGRPYYIRDIVVYPTAHDIVKPLVDNGTSLVEWWKDTDDRETAHKKAQTEND